MGRITSVEGSGERVKSVCPRSVRVGARRRGGRGRSVGRRCGSGGLDRARDEWGK